MPLPTSLDGAAAGRLVRVLDGYYDYAPSLDPEEGIEWHVKICDQVSDAILDAFLALDPTARVACETLAAGNMIGVYGEVTSSAIVDIESLVRDVVREVGYTDPEYGLDAATCDVRVVLRPQAPEIATAVSHDGAADPFDAVGAGDQGLVFGYATDETAMLMPLPLDLALAPELVGDARPYPCHPGHDVPFGRYTIRYPGTPPIDQYAASDLRREPMAFDTLEDSSPSDRSGVREDE